MEGVGLILDVIGLLLQLLGMEGEAQAAAAARDQAAALRAAQYERIVEGFISQLESEDEAVVMLARLQEVSEGGIDNATLMAMANLAMSSEVTEDPEVMVDLLEVAETRAAILGRDVQSVWGDMITGIATLNEDLLAQQGLIVDTDAAYEDYATQVLHKPVDSMSTLEKQQALMRALSADEVTQELAERPAFDPSALERTLAGSLDEMTTEGQRLLYGPELENEYRKHLFDQYTMWMDWLEVNDPEAYNFLQAKFNSALASIYKKWGYAPDKAVELLMHDPEVIEKFAELESLYGHSLAAKKAALMQGQSTSTASESGGGSAGGGRPPLAEGEGDEQLYILPEAGAPSPQGAVFEIKADWLADGAALATDAFIEALDAEQERVTAKRDEMIDHIAASIQAAFTPEYIRQLAMQAVVGGGVRSALHSRGYIP